MSTAESHRDLSGYSVEHRPKAKKESGKAEGHCNKPGRNKRQRQKKERNIERQLGGREGMEKKAEKGVNCKE